MIDDYSIRDLANDEFLPLFERHKGSAFRNIHAYDISDVMNPIEKEKSRELSQSTHGHFRLQLGVFDKNNDFAGWLWGMQESAATFYMVNAAVLDSHRRKGLFGALIRRCVEIVSDKGFQVIYSRTHATNNIVIIPTLKAGFVISKMEIDDKFGVLLHMHYYVNEDRRRVMDYRSGYLTPDENIKRLFGI